MFKRTLVVLLATLGSSAAHAFVECAATPTALHVGDEGSFYIFLTNGGIARIFHTDPDFKQTVALATAAHLAGRSIMLRYADGTACNAAIAEIVGLRI